MGNGSIIVISEDRYNELIRTEERVRIAVDFFQKQKYPDPIDVLFILGTEKSYEVAGIYKEERKDLREKVGNGGCLRK